MELECIKKKETVYGDVFIGIRDIYKTDKGINVIKYKNKYFVVKREQACWKIAEEYLEGDF